MPSLPAKQLMRTEPGAHSLGQVGRVAAALTVAETAVAAPVATLHEDFAAALESEAATAAPGRTAEVATAVQASTATGIANAAATAAGDTGNARTGGQSWWLPALAVATGVVVVWLFVRGRSRQPPGGPAGPS